MLTVGSGGLFANSGVLELDGGGGGTAGASGGTGALLTVQSGGSLTNGGTIAIGGGLGGNGYNYDVNHDVIPAGGGYGGGLIVASGAVLGNTGTIALTGGGAGVQSGLAGGGASLTVASGSILTNSGQVQVGSGALLIDAGALGAVGGGGIAVSSGGTAIVSSGGTAAGLVVSSGGTVRLDGTLIFGVGAVYGEDGSIAGSGGIVVSGGTLVLDGQDGFTGGVVLGGGSVELAAGNGAGSGSVTFAGPATLQIDGAAMPTGTIGGFAAGDVIDLSGVAFDPTGSAQLGSGNILEVTENGYAYDLHLDPAQDFSGAYFHLSDRAGTAITLDAVPCYCPGTRILTDQGERPVEALHIGDTLVTAAGEFRPIKWIGRRSFTGRFLAANPAVQPIRFRAGSLGGGLPRRDLLVSPAHAMLLDGLLIPARCLVNGGTITQERGLQRVEYIHVELDSHDILLAEGAASESFIDDGSRGMFHNAAEFAVRYPGEPSRRDYCAPRVEQGAGLEAIRRRLTAEVA